MAAGVTARVVPLNVYDDGAQFETKATVAWGKNCCGHFDRQGAASLFNYCPSMYQHVSLHACIHIPDLLNEVHD